MIINKQDHELSLVQQPEALEDEPIIEFYGIADKLNQEDGDFVDLLNDNYNNNNM